MDKCIRLLADVDQINQCRINIKQKEGSFTQLASILDLAGNEVRLKILFLLEQENELCPCDLSDILNMTVPAISQHLRKLRDGNIIQSRKEGQTIFYSVKEDHIKVLRPFFKYLNQTSTSSVPV